MEIGLRIFVQFQSKVQMQFDVEIDFEQNLV